MEKRVIPFSLPDISELEINEVAEWLDYNRSKDERVRT